MSNKKNPPKGSGQEQNKRQGVAIHKATAWKLRVLSVFCILMAIGAAQTSIISAALMLIVGFGCLPGVIMTVGVRVSPKAHAITLIVLTVIALAISNMMLTTG